MKFALCLCVLFLSCNSVPVSKGTYGISTICIEGHVYYKTVGNSSIAPKLTDDGKPVKCDCSTFSR